MILINNTIIYNYIRFNTILSIDLFPIRLAFQVALSATIIATIIGVAMGYLLARREFTGKNLLDILITLPLALPPTVLGYYLLVLIGNRSLIGRVWQLLFGSPLVFTWQAAVIAAVIPALPTIIKSTRAAIEAVSPTLEQAAYSLGANPLRVFGTITLPLAWPGILAGMILAFVRALGEFGITLMVAGNIPGQTQTAALAIYDAVQAGRNNEALDIVVMVSIIVTILLYLSNFLTYRRQ